MKAALTLVFLSFLAVGQAAVARPLDFEIASFSLVDDIIKGILEKVRPNLANLSFPDIDEKVNSSYLNATIVAKNITLTNADKFVVRNLKSSLIPLKLNNITLTWNELIGNAFYDIKGELDIPLLAGNIYGKGQAKAALSGIFLTVGANLEMKDKYIQIKPRGLFGFDLSIAKANITLESVMGSEELGKTAGDFLSIILPNVVNELKKPIFEAYQDDLIKFLNSYLRGSKGKEIFDEIDLSEEASNELDFDNFFEDLDQL